MNFDDFVGQVMNDLQLGKKSEGVRAVRATLTTLAERLQEGEAEDLAGALPMELDFYVRNAEHGQRFGFDEFIDRVMAIEGSERPDAVWRAKTVVKIMDQAIPQGEMDDIRQNLPEEFDPLFELTEIEE